MKLAVLLSATMIILVVLGCGSSDDSAGPDRDSSATPASSSQESTSIATGSSDSPVVSSRSGDDASAIESPTTETILTAEDQSSALSDSGRFGSADGGSTIADTSSLPPPVSSSELSDPPDWQAPAQGGNSPAVKEPPVAPDDTVSADAVADAVELQVGQQYAGGTAVKISELGISFSIPNDWYGGIPQGAEAMILGSDTQPGLVMIAGQQTTSVEEVVAAMSQSFPLDQTTFLSPVAAPQFSGDWIAVAYGGTDGVNPLVGFSMARIDSNGSGILFLASGPQDKGDYYANLVGQLAGSTQIGAVTTAAAPVDSAISQNPASETATSPLAQEWHQFLAGMRLAYLSSSDYGEGVGSSVDRKMYLCSSGQFYYTDESLVTGGSAGFNPTQVQENGEWQILADGDRAGLELRWQGGQVSAHLLQYNNGETYVDEERWFVTDDNTFCQ